MPVIVRESIARTCSSVGFRARNLSRDRLVPLTGPGRPDMGENTVGNDYLDGTELVCELPGDGPSLSGSAFIFEQSSFSGHSGTIRAFYQVIEPG